MGKRYLVGAEEVDVGLWYWRVEVYLFGLYKYAPMLISLPLGSRSPL